MRQGMGIVACAAMAAFASFAPAHGAVTVIGAGYARDCYELTASRAGRMSDALALCDLALEQEPLTTRDRAATYVNRGILKLRAENHQDALADFDRSLALAPNLYEAKINIGAAYIYLKRYEEALAMLDEGIKTDNLPARAIGFYNRGLVKEQLGDVPGAYYDFKASVELSPNFAEPAKELKRFTVVTEPAD